jgi:hypothetical protein
MKYISSLISLSLLLAAEPSKIIANQTSPTEQTATESQSDIAYIDLSKEESNIAKIIAHLSDLDEQPHSLIHQLNKHIQEGYDFAEYDAIIETLQYAESFLIHNNIN